MAHDKNFGSWKILVANQKTNFNNLNWSGLKIQIRKISHRRGRIKWLYQDRRTAIIIWKNRLFWNYKSNIKIFKFANLVTYRIRLDEVHSIIRCGICVIFGYSIPWIDLTLDLSRFLVLNHKFFIEELLRKAIFFELISFTFISYVCVRSK